MAIITCQLTREDKFSTISRFSVRTGGGFRLKKREKSRNKQKSSFNHYLGAGYCLKRSKLILLSKVLSLFFLLIPATALWSSTIAIWEAAPSRPSATAASQTYTSMLNGHSKKYQKKKLGHLVAVSESECWIKPSLNMACKCTKVTFHYTTLFRQARKQHPQHLWGHQTPENQHKNTILTWPWNLWGDTQNRIWQKWETKERSK